MIIKSTHENNAAQSSIFHIFLFKRTLFRIILFLLVCIAMMTKPVLAQGTSYTYYFDGDGDGYGKSNSAITSEDPSPPPDYASQDGDCNDGDKSVHPNAEEICGDGIDNNCNGQTDEGCPCFVYLDNDGDGYGQTGTATQVPCDEGIPGYVGQGGDCNDDDPAVHPNAAEICGNGIDDNCNGQMDEGCTCFAYFDADGDGYGNPITEQQVPCGTMIPGYVGQGGDCNDNDPLVHPNAAETCGNGVDDNCNGQVDEGCSCFAYLDADEDGYGDPATATQVTCGTMIPGYVGQGGDCNDNDPSIHPNAAEICGNGIDDNCNGQVDESCSCFAYIDVDGDGYGNSFTATPVTCGEMIPGYVGQGGDCNDNDPFIHPNAAEICGNGFDDNCNGQVDEGCSCFAYFDADGDGYGDPATETPVTCGEMIPGYVGLGGDCNDNDPSIHLNAEEICGNGIDDDCDGQVDEKCPCFAYLDTDGDGYGDPATATPVTCGEMIPGYVGLGGDCNDNDPLVHPNAAEICGNHVDDNCDGQVDEECAVHTYYIDNDGDTYGGYYWIEVTDTVPPPGYTTRDGDCNDYDGAVHPGATEICNRIDDNCDGVVDEGCLKEQLPDFTKTDISGVSHHFYGDLAAGNAVIIEFSTGWCVPSLIAEPQISNVYDDICQGQGNIKLYDVVFEDEVQGHQSDLAFGIRYANLHNALYPVIVNSQDVYGDFAYEYSLGFVPTFLVVIPDANDPAKSAVHIIVGAIDNLKDSIENILANHGYIINPPPTLSISVSGSVCNLPSPITLSANRSSGIVWSTGETTRNITVTEEGDYYLYYTAGCGTITKKVHLAKPVTGTLSSPATTACAGKGVITLQYDGGTPDATLQYSTDGTNWADFIPNFQGIRAFLNPYPAGTTVSFRVHEAISPGNGASPCDVYSAIVQIVSTEMAGPQFEIAADRTDCSFPVTLTSPYSENNIWSTEETTQNITVYSPGTYYVINSAACGEVADLISINDATSIWYLDADGDGYGDSHTTKLACIQPDGYVPYQDDCNDANATVHPGAPEICGNGIDDNCNGQTDECISYTYYLDKDADGYGKNSGMLVSTLASPPPGYAAAGGDCDDDHATVHPGATEICDGLDNNCNGQVDEGFTKVTYYADADGDGYGNAALFVSACSKPAGYVTNNTDCDDTKASVYPGATEIHDGIDNDCDGKTDEKTTFYRDADGDGFGDPAMFIKAWIMPAGYVANKKDCNDSDAAIYAGALDICDGLDNDCDGFVDEDCSGVTIADVSIVEGNKSQKTMSFIVTLNKKSVQTITVEYTTQSVSAAEGEDYIATSGTLTFLPGIKSQKITVAIKGDKMIESNETFKVNLSNAVNASIVKTAGIGTILNDDGTALASTISSVKTVDIHSAKISPTPANSFLRIELSGYAGNVTLQLISMQGKMLLQKKVQAISNFAKEQINVSDLASGAYLLAIIDDKGNMKTEKVIISH